MKKPTWEVVNIDWAKPNVVAEGLTEQRAKALAERLDGLAMRCIARPSK